MVDIHTIINDHRSKRSRRRTGEGRAGREGQQGPTSSEIPDLFFDEILVTFKLTRIEIMVLMYLYRRVWCRLNLYREFGISQLLSHTEMAKGLGPGIDEIHLALKKLEEHDFISTIRSGQYFVRRYFTRDNDKKFGQSYDDFDM